MKDPGRPDRKAYIQQKSVYRIQQKPRGRQGGLGSEARQGAFTEGPNEAIAEFRGRGDARVHERKQRDCLSSAREEGDGTQEVLPRTTTTLVVLKTSGTTLW